MEEKKKIGTKITGSVEGTPKTLQPGNITCKINEITIEDVSRFKEGALSIVLNLESEPIPNFEGFHVDKDNPDSPVYLGQVGRVKATEWAFADGETKAGTIVNRDEEIVRFLKGLCIALGRVDWLEGEDDKHDTIESLIEAFNQSGISKGVFLDFCICGKEYNNKKGYTAYDLFLPRPSKTGGAFCLKGAKKVAIFDPEKHIKKRKTDTVKDFKDEQPTGGSEDEFNI